MNSGIYCIENMIDGKKYIGYASNITNRWKQHKSELRGNYHDNKYLLNAWNKYGEQNFKFWIIEEYPKEKLKLMEIYFIVYYNSFYQDGNGYNLSRGGESCFGVRHSEEAKKKMSETMKGKNNPNFGKIFSEEYREKLRNSSRHLSGENHPMFGKTGENNPNFGRRNSEKVKKRMSEAMKGKKFKGSSSPYFGVSFNNLAKKWIVTIFLNRESKYIGRYKEEMDAAKAYDKYVIENNLLKPLNFKKEEK